MREKKETRGPGTPGAEEPRASHRLVDRPGGDRLRIRVDCAEAYGIGAADPSVLQLPNHL